MHIDDVIEMMRGKAELLAQSPEATLANDIAAFTSEVDTMLAAMFDAGTLTERPDREPAAVLLFLAAELCTDATCRAALERLAAERATAYAQHLNSIARQLRNPQQH